MVRKFRVGDWVEVRSKEEILRTLGSNGQLDGMPFMPEMFVYCGKRFRVYKRAHKTCDTVFPTRGRRVSRAVHLETRCDGAAHGGCQAGCLIFWKESWLKPVESNDDREIVAFVEPTHRDDISGCTESEVCAGVQGSDPKNGSSMYVCQATQLPYASSDLSWWDIRQYVEDYLSGNVSLGQLFKGLSYSVYYHASQAGIGLGRPLRSLYDKVSWLWGGSKFPRSGGKIPVGEPTPTVTLNLQPGEVVRVKPHEEILRTITTDNKNRGMSWDAEMVPYCGGTFRVLKRVTQIVNEKTGEMQQMKNACVILDTVICQARYSGCRMFCPRSLYPFWREIWLERVAPDVSCADIDNQANVALARGNSIVPHLPGQGRVQSNGRTVEIGKR